MTKQRGVIVYVCDGLPCGKVGKPCEFTYYSENGEGIPRKWIPCLYDDVGNVELKEKEE